MAKITESEDCKLRAILKCSKTRCKTCSETTRSNVKKPICKKATLPSKERQEYFRGLYSLFSECTWKNLKEWEKVLFFSNWFIAISDVYVNSRMEYDELFKRFAFNKNRKPALISSTEYRKRIRNFLVENQRAISLYKISCLLNMPFDSGEMEETLKSRVKLTFPPAVGFFLHEAESELSYCRTHIEKYLTLPGFHQSRMVRINIAYPTDVILDKIKKYIEHEKLQYSSEYRSDIPDIDKRDSKNRPDAYPFDNWAEYIEVFIRSEAGETYRNIDPNLVGRVGPRYKEKARKLSEAEINRRVSAFYPPDTLSK